MWRAARYPPGCRRASRRIERLSSVAGALADATRLAILLALIEREATVSELVALLGVPQPRVSTHLAMLPAPGSSLRADGRRRLYAVDAARVEPLLTGLQFAAAADARAGRARAAGDRARHAAAAGAAMLRPRRRRGRRRAARCAARARLACSGGRRRRARALRPRARRRGRPPARGVDLAGAVAPVASTPSAARTGPSAGRISGVRSGARSRTRSSATASSRARRDGATSHSSGRSSRGSTGLVTPALQVRASPLPITCGRHDPAEFHPMGHRRSHAEAVGCRWDRAETPTKDVIV